MSPDTTKRDPDDGEVWLHCGLIFQPSQPGKPLYGECHRNITKDFTLSYGYLLDVGLWRDQNPISNEAACNLAFLNPSKQSVACSEREDTTGPVPCGAAAGYLLRNLSKSSEGYYTTTPPFDLRYADQIADIELNTIFVHQFQARLPTLLESA